MSGTDMLHQNFSMLPFTVNMVSDKQNKERKSKLDTIGTLLEKAIIHNPFKSPNTYQSVPAVFINQKLYGKATQDDPVNNIELVRKMKGIPSFEESFYRRSTQQSTTDQKGYNTYGRPSTLKGKDETVRDLDRKTAFRTNFKESNGEKHIDAYLGNWFATTKGLPMEWQKKAKDNK